MIRPKMFLANDGNYRELRWFAPWMKYKTAVDFNLPKEVTDVTGQSTTKFGDVLLQFQDACFGTELCEELFTPESPHIQMALDGVEIFSNGSGSHHEFAQPQRQVCDRTNFQNNILQSGGIYLYSNQQGCDGERTYYDGCALIAVNGKIVARGSQFSIGDVEVITATVDLEKVRSFRSSVSRNLQAVATKHFPRVLRTESVCQQLFQNGKKIAETPVHDIQYHQPEDEISHHVDLNIDEITSSVLHVFLVATGKKPLFKIFGGSDNENLALQNIQVGENRGGKLNTVLQARTRMVVAYLFAQLLPWSLGVKKSLLVLGSANVDETLRGYFTKYDCSSADLNPIGGISKEDLRRFIAGAQTYFKIPLLGEFLNATPTAELEPLTESYTQSDEVVFIVYGLADMGMTYEELSVFGTLRKVFKCGPYQMFLNLLDQWNKLPVDLIAAKTTILPPSYHMSPYSPDDNRFDLRPILYNAGWNYQFQKIDEAVAKMKDH
ncbi:glutamine-dependent NAD(+) synthetase [Phlyctochytrium planicorne]|nr:glutamine-dependent NAD(+) synthetase [Phlyctochytrium planicorne]